MQADIRSLRSERVIEFLTKATAALDAEDFRTAIGWTNSAFEYAFEHGGENIVGRTVNVHELVVRDYRGDIYPPGRAGGGDEAAIALRRLQILGRLNAFNMSVREYLYWRNRFALAPKVNISGGLSAARDPGWTRDDVQAALGYVLDSALNMERVTPDLEPGGFYRGGSDKL
jgi:hypothetical protein